MNKPIKSNFYFEKPIKGYWLGFWLVFLLIFYQGLQLGFGKWGLVISQWAGFILPALVLIQKLKPKPLFVWSDYKLNFVKIFFLSVVVSLAIYFLSLLSEMIFPAPKEWEEFFKSLFHFHWRFGYIYDWFVIAVFPAIGEELLFRGLLFTALLIKFKPKTACMIQALIFAGYHFNPWHFIFLAALGYYFGWVYLKTKNLGLAMLAHLINNTLGVIVYYQTNGF